MSTVDDKDAVDVRVSNRIKSRLAAAADAQILENWQLSPNPI